MTRTVTSTDSRPGRTYGERGQTLVLVALGLFVIVGMAALVVDLGYWYFHAGRIQRAADAAAMAGVVYMPGEFSPNAQQVAQNVAADNGFSSSNPNYTIAVNRVNGQPQELSVSITDKSVPGFFARVFGLKSIIETRSAVAQYNPSIPLGSPENSFGTGNLSLGTGSPSNIWAAVNGYCTSKENGDQFLSYLDATWNGNAWTCPAVPSKPAVLNTEYSPSGYYYDIVTPTATGTLGSAISVQAYDPAYMTSGCSQSPDIALGGASSTVTTGYALYYAQVPSDHSQDLIQPQGYNPNNNNPAVFATNQASTCAQWTTLFTIPAGAPNGEYRLKVYTQAGQANSDGSNSYALRVYSTPTFSRCTTITGLGWSSPTCPTIHGESALSVYANQNGATGSFYLAAINAQYAGHTMQVNLFDPGEGDHFIQVLDPDGNAVKFTYQTTDDNTGCPDCGSNIGFQPYSGSSSGSPGLDVSGTIQPPQGVDSNSIYNDRHVQLTIQVPANYAADNGGWWSIKYTAQSGTITDRTTWSVAVLGAPVHLVG